MVDAAKHAGTRAQNQTEAAQSASERAVHATKMAKAAAQRAEAETAEAKDDSARASHAAGRAADAARKAAEAARTAIGAARAANRAARIAADAAARAATASALAGQAASRAYTAASNAAREASKADEARQAAEHARDAAAGARSAAKAADAAFDAVSAVLTAAQAAKDAAAYARQAGQAASQAGHYRHVSEAQAARARRAGARAQEQAERATRAANAATDLANRAAEAASTASDAARSAARHADAAAKAAEQAAEHAGEANDAARLATQHANAAIAAAEDARNAAEEAQTVVKLARETEAEKLRTAKKEAIQHAKGLKRRLTDQQERIEWVNAERKRVTTETRRLLEAASAPDATSAEVVNKGRAAALNLLTHGGPWTRRAAAHALTGTAVDVRQWVDKGRMVVAEQDDRARVAYIADTGEPQALREAARTALNGTYADIKEFLATKAYPGEEHDDRIRVMQILSNATGPAVREAANDAMDGTHADVEKFLTHGQYVAREHDNRINTLRAKESGGPHVKALASVALAGPPKFLSAFLSGGRDWAARRDAVAASHAAEMRRYVNTAFEIAARAAEDAYRAAEAAARARQAADNADRYAQQAHESSNQAANYAEQARESAEAAQQSAEQAAQSARTARHAAARARADANQAADSAAAATGSAVQAGIYARQAYASADRAWAAAREAGDDLKAAAQAALDAIESWIHKKREQQQDARDAIEDGNGKYGTPPKVYLNHTLLVKAGGTCYLNGITLPDSMGVSCHALARSFDNWLGLISHPALWNNLQGDPMAAHRLLATYCMSHRQGCGKDLVNQLDVTPVKLNRYCNVTPSMCGWNVPTRGGTIWMPGRGVLRFGLKAIARGIRSSLGSDSPGLTPTKVPSVIRLIDRARTGKISFRSHTSAFSHYLKHVKGIIKNSNGKFVQGKKTPDMSEFESFSAYLRAARRFMGRGHAPGVKQGTRQSDGALVRFDPTSGWFGIRAPDGTIRTFFRPNKGLQYFRKQVG